MHPYRYRITALVVAILPCAELPAEEKDWDYWGVELVRGYTSDAKQPLLDFLNDWHARSKPISPQLLKRKPAFEQAVYDLYGAFFRPDERHYKTTEFIVIQDKLDVRIVNSDFRRVFEAKTQDHESLVRKLPQISHLVFKDFRPQIKQDGKKLLYLEQDRLAAMLTFLTETNGYRMIDRYWDEDCESDEQKARLRYLNSALEVFPGHWGTGWHFETHPYVNTVYLSAEFKKAVLVYRVYYGFGEVLMTHEDDGGWKIVSNKGTFEE